MEYADAERQLRKDFEDNTMEEIAAIQVAKYDLARNNLLVNVPCPYCENPGLVATQEVKEKLVALYDDLRNNGFHCREHSTAVHRLIHNFRTWSCCD